MLQSLPVELVEIAQVVFHLHGYLLPRVEAQIPQLQQRLVFRVVDPFDNTDDFPLQIHQRIYVLVDLVFQINDFDNDILHGLHIPAPAGRGVGQGRGGLGRQGPQARHLFQLAVDPLVDAVSLTEIFFHRHREPPSAEMAADTSSTEVTI